MLSQKQENRKESSGTEQVLEVFKILSLKNQSNLQDFTKEKKQDKNHIDCLTSFYNEGCHRGRCNGGYKFFEEAVRWPRLEVVA